MKPKVHAHPGAPNSSRFSCFALSRTFRLRLRSTGQPAEMVVHRNCGDVGGPPLTAELFEQQPAAIAAGRFQGNHDNPIGARSL